jgi:hypothetical protein
MEKKMRRFGYQIVGFTTMSREDVEACIDTFLREVVDEQDRMNLVLEMDDSQIEKAYEDFKL